MDFDRIIVSDDYGWKYGGFGIEMGESIERTPANFKEILRLDYQIDPCA
jgi:hypothetical protein